MKIAVTYDNSNIFQHFGHTSQFKIYEITDKKITASYIMDTNGSGHGALATLLASADIEILICGGIGAGAQNALAEAGIKLYGCVTGNADEAVADFLADKLAFDPDVHCSHHDHAHGEHHCSGHHTCGSK